MKSQAHGNGKVSLAERVAKLEAEVERLKAEANQPRGWRAIVGIEKDNPYFTDVAQEIQRLRQEDYAQVCAEIDAQEVALAQRRRKRSRRKVLSKR